MNLNSGKARCIGWRRSVKMGGSKAHPWEQLPLVSSRETTWPLCPGQWGATRALEDTLTSSVNDPVAIRAAVCAPAAIRSFPSHRGSASTLYTVAAIYSRIFFSRWLCLLRNKAGRSSGIRRQRAKTATLVAACNCGSFLCSTWHKDMPKKKKRTFWTCKNCECTFSLCDNDTFRCLSAFPAIFCRDFGLFTCSHWKPPKLSGHTRSTFLEVEGNGAGRGKYCQ